VRKQDPKSFEAMTIADSKDNGRPTWARRGQARRIFSAENSHVFSSAWLYVVGVAVLLTTLPVTVAHQVTRPSQTHHCLSAHMPLDRHNAASGMEGINGGLSFRDRRQFLLNGLRLTAFGWSLASPANAADKKSRASLDSCLYSILRVREATEQETRLISTGKFKDIQRANVKLAVKFMVENYRLVDAFNTASVYLPGSDSRITASQVGQRAVQNLYTILEYFDSSDVQNLKVRFEHCQIVARQRQSSNFCLLLCLILP
jgi:hypothetical protein